MKSGKSSSFLYLKWDIIKSSCLKYIMNKNFCVIVVLLIVSFSFLAISIDRNIRYPVKFYDLINPLCVSYNIDEALCLAIIKTESNFNEDAVSSAGAIGLMQLLPSTASYIASIIDYEDRIDLTYPKCNIELGLAYFSYLLARFEKLDYAICAYNAGEGRVREWIQTGEINNVPYKETNEYLMKVKFAYNIYQHKI